jgi:hypothetical protein
MPWNADDENAWWLLRHDLPNEIRLSGHTFALWFDDHLKCCRPLGGVQPVITR